VMDQVHLTKVLVLYEPKDFVGFRVEELGLGRENHNAHNGNRGQSSPHGPSLA